MTRLRSRPTPPAAATPAGRGRTPGTPSPAEAGQKQPAAGKARPKPAQKPRRSGPVDRLRPNLFISPVIGRARARPARKAESAKLQAAAQPAATGGTKTPSKTEKKRATDTAKSDAPTPASAKNKTGQTRVASKRAADTSAKSAAASGGKKASQTRAKKEPGTDVPTATQAAAEFEVRPPAPGRARAKRARDTGAVRSNTKAAGVPAEKTPRRAPVSGARTTEPTVQTAEPAPLPKGKTPSRTRPKKDGSADVSRSRVGPSSKPPSRDKPAAAANGDLSKRRTCKPPAVAGKRDEAASAAGGEQNKTVSATAGSRAGTTASKSTSSHAAATSKSAGNNRNTVSAPSADRTRPARPSKPATAAGVYALKRPMTHVPPAPSIHPSGTIASATVAAAATGETPSKRQRLSAMSPKAVTFPLQEAAPSPSRFTALLPRPPLPAAPPSAAAAPLPPTAAVAERLTAAATPRRHRLPRHVTSTPCGPPAPPPPVADSAATCYGFLEDVEAEEVDEERAPLEQLVSPVGVARARRLPPPAHPRLRDATNLPSRFNVGRLVRKPGGERSEVTTTVASQLMDPELTFSKPASRSYSRRRHPSVSAGHSTFGHSTLGSETSAATGADVTRAKKRSHHKKERDEQLEAEMEKWAASVNSVLSAVDSFELVVERT